MPKNRRLNLNNYITVDTEDKASLIIIPWQVDGKDQPPIYLKSKRTPKLKVDDVTTATWIPTIEISKKGTPEEYNMRVNWWFDNSSDWYKQQIADTYKNLSNLQTVIQQAKTWLLTTGSYTQSTTGEYIKRRSDINKFLKNWLRKNLNQQE